MEIKLFICIWGVGYVGCTKKARIEVNTLKFFTDESGFDGRDIEEIKRLDVGQCSKLYTSGNLSVVRVQ